MTHQENMTKRRSAVGTCTETGVLHVLYTLPEFVIVGILKGESMWIAIWTGVEMPLSVDCAIRGRVLGEED